MRDTMGAPHPQPPPRPAASTGAEAASPAAAGLGAWNYYFLLKLLLLWRGVSGLHPAENLLLAAALAWPLAAPRWRRARTLVALPVAAALLYYDSYLPPAAHLLSQAHQLAHFNAAYLLELAGRLVQWPLLAALAAAALTLRLAAAYIRLGTIVFVALGALLLAPARQDGAPALAAAPAPGNAANAAGGADAATPDQFLQRFYASEASRAVSFGHPTATDAPFDLIFLQICSLSWDDLQASGMDQHPLWKNADFLFHHFNSAASYSGPAAVRLLRGPCGQSSHKGLYDAAPEQCKLMPSLAQAGFETRFAMNHDGHFDNFLNLVRQQGVAAPLMAMNGVAVAQRAFDESAIYDDLATLQRWQAARAQDSAPRVALFYNTISLHDGNRVVAGSLAGKSSMDSYKGRATRLLDDIAQFIGQLERSGRRAVVVVVPEHGAALRGDRMQIAGLREIATPAITSVPVAVKVIGPDAHAQGGTAHINDTTSYNYISQLVAAMIAKPPFGADGFSPASYTAGLTGTPYVAENESATLLQQGGRYWLKQGGEPWAVYDPAQR